MATREYEIQVGEPLTRLRRRLRRLRAGIGAAKAGAVIVAAAALQFLLDWWLRLRLDMRAALLLVLAVASGWALWRHLVKPLRVRFANREMALALEARHPELDAVLVSAVDFAEGRVGAAESNSPELVRAVIAEAAAKARDVPFDGLINRKQGRAALVLGALVLAIIVGAFRLEPEAMGIWVDRNLLLRDVSWPQRNQLIVDAPPDGVIRGAIGDDLELRARSAEGYDVPRQVEIIYRTESGSSGRETMTGVGERGYRIIFPGAREGFSFHLEGGDDTTESYRVELAERPVIASATLTVTPPAYTRLPPATLAEGLHAAEMYRGSRLTISAQASKLLTSAELRCGSLVVETLEPQGRTLVAEITPTESQTYHFALKDQDGLTNARPARFSARILEDRQPTVRLTAPGVGNLVTRRAVLPLDMSFSDELGLAEALLVFRHSGEGGELVELALDGFQAGATAFDAHLDWAVSDAQAAEGEEITLLARAMDFNDVTGPGVGESTTITFRVAADDELLAEFRRREQEYRRQFERLVDSQERLRRRLLTVLANIGPATPGEELAAQLAPLERQQRQVRAQVNMVEQQFTQVLAEMRINRLDDGQTRARIADGIIRPLSELGGREMSDAADQLRRLARENDADLALAVDPVQAQICGKMRQVLDNMLQWEGFQETVTMLREILQLQRELNNETKAAGERQGSSFFYD